MVELRRGYRCLIVAASAITTVAFHGPSASAFRASQTLFTSKDTSTHQVTTAPDAFVHDFFSSECDDSNLPPSLSIISRSFEQLESGSDIRGRFVDHPRRGSIASVARAIRGEKLAALTPFASHCLGFAFATMLKNLEENVVICVGQDPRFHGTCLADAFSRGAESVNGVRVVYTGLATTPSMYEFCRYVEYYAYWYWSPIQLCVSQTYCCTDLDYAPDPS